MITAKQFEAALDEGIPYMYTPWRATEPVEATFDNHSFWDEAEDQQTEYDLPGFDDVKVTYVDGETGGEGSAEHIWQVWRVVTKAGDLDEVQYFKKTGYYASYDGSNWDGSLYEVEPFEKTVTDWRTKK
jgi:hypothetical protein